MKQWICGWCSSINIQEENKLNGDAVWCSSCNEMSQVTDQTETSLMVDVPSAVTFGTTNRKHCTCEIPAIVIDTKNHTVECAKCNVVIDPFYALKKLAESNGRYKSMIQSLRREQKELANYKPWRRGMKMIERMCKDGDMVPTCPNCKEPFHLEQLTHWVNKRFFKVKGDE